jgi:glycosyltransferase involved in cell wall biosynthesis
MMMYEKMNILFLSNMMEEKGVYTLLDACKLLKAKEYPFECHFVGKWSDVSEDAFNKYVGDNQLTDFVFAHGAQYGADKEQYWSAANLFVFPTYYHNECFPLVLLEAMQHRVACISTNEGGIANIIDEGVTGYIVKAKDAVVLAEKIECCLQDPERCHEMGRKGYEKFEREFTLDCFERNMKGGLESLL